MARKLCTYRMPGHIDGGNNHRFDLAYEMSRRLTFGPNGDANDNEAGGAEAFLFL